MVLAGIAGLLLPWESNEGDERTFVTFVSAPSFTRYEHKRPAQGAEGLRLSAATR